MKQFQFEITINAPKEKVWDTMLSPDTYREWTGAFMPGSHYEGNWELGSEILFVSVSEETGKTEGVAAMIIANKQYEHVSSEVTALIENGSKDSSSDNAISWIGTTESYTFTEHSGMTHLLVEISTAASDDDAAMYTESWPEALQKLKQISER